MSLPGTLAAQLGRPDLARGNTVARSGQGVVYGQGGTAVGLRASASVGSASGGVNFDTGTLSVLMLAGITVGLILFATWTKGSQA